VNQLNGNTIENAQVNANMNAVYALLGDDTQEESSYESDLLIAA